MADLKPSLASYARVAYARELLGDVAGARAALRLAVEAGGAVPEHAAWSLVQLGNLEFGAGRLTAASRIYREALRRLPGYASADAGVARVEAARGRLSDSIARLQAVVDRVPLPEYAARLADLYDAAGRRAEAARTEGLVRTIERVLAANGVRTELETALFDLDRGVRLRDALARARDYVSRSPSLQAEDVLAWALVRNGRCAEALVHSKRALRLGTRDALMWFHRGAAERCLGRHRAARAALREALAINPYFSVRWAPVVRRWAAMKKLLLVALVALALPTGAAAHPLGNFTVNHYGELDLSGSSVYVRFVLDLAEIPTYQAGDRVRAPGYAAQVARELELEVDGRPAALVAITSRVSEKPGAGGLPTLRFEAVYKADRAGRELVFRDRTFPGRIGWRELVARADRGAQILSADVPAASRSDALRAYPKDLLRSPLDVRVARVSYEPGAHPVPAPALGATAAPDRPHGGFESLVAQGDLTAGVILVSLAVAMFWGAAHALTPGHGKAIVAGYLVGSRGKPRHAIGLGLIVTASHTVGVFALGLVTLLLSQFIVPERLYPWLTLVSGLLVVGVGISVFRARLRHRHAHAHAYPHHHDHDHETRSLLGVGVAAGILPCPSALVVLLSAIALHRVGFGLALILAFSAGLALTISSIGLLAVLARRTFGRLRLDGPLVRVLPAASALLILGVGVAITLNALPEVL